MGRDLVCTCVCSGRFSLHHIKGSSASTLERSAKVPHNLGRLSGVRMLRSPPLSRPPLRWPGIRHGSDACHFRLSTEQDGTGTFYQRRIPSRSSSNS
nr:hypothetical protein CFP56_38759 [Quercus suber]